MNDHQETLISFIQKYVDLPAQDLALITSGFEERRIFKNEIIFPVGAVCEEFVFVVEGALRFFFTTGEIETSVWFSFQNSVGSEVQSFISGKPCKFNVQALTDGCLLSINKMAFGRLRHKSKAFDEFYTKLCEETAIYAIDRLVDFQYKSAEQRYNDLLATPHYLENIPQKYLASYLGITPTSLSRLRKKIAAG